MSNVEKLKKKAADFEAKRQIDKAIQTYLELFRAWQNDDRADVDVALYNRVGDMLLRAGNVGDAMTVWETAVDHYAEGGFHNNAIALCNKILRHSPGRTAVYYKLGKMSAQKGFKGDARKNYLEYADRMQTAGNMDEAFRALKEFADLCPDDNDIRQTLADQLSRIGRHAEAVEQLQVLYERFESMGDAAAAAATVDRMKAIDPSVEPRRSGPRAARQTSGLVFLDLDAPGPAPSAGAPPRKSVAASPPRTSQTAPPSSATTARGPERRASAKSAFEGLPLIDTNDSPPAPPPNVERFATPPSSAPVAEAPVVQDITFGASFGTDEPATAQPPVDDAPLDLEPTSLAGAEAAVSSALSSPEDVTFGTSDADAFDTSVLSVEPELIEFQPDLVLDGGENLTLSDTGADAEVVAGESVEIELSAEVAQVDDSQSVAEVEPVDLTPDDAATAIGSDYGLPTVTPAEFPPVRRTMRPTMSVLAQSVDLLRDRLSNDDTNWQLRRQFGEALLEDGDREGGLEQLEAAMAGFEQDGDLDSARSVADEIIRLNPYSIRHHQKRVEFAFRMSDQPRLIEAYVELADALFREGQSEKSRVVYERVLELAPNDARAVAAMASFSDPDDDEPPRRASSRDKARRTRGTRAARYLDESLDDAVDAAMELTLRPDESAPAAARADQHAAAADVSYIETDATDATLAQETIESAAEVYAGDSGEVAAIAPETDLYDDVGADAAVADAAVADAEANPADALLDTAQYAEPAVQSDASVEYEAVEPEPSPAQFARTPTPSGVSPIVPDDIPRPAPRRLTERDGGNDFVDLEDWLKEEELPKSTRMVVEERQTGDEDADFRDMLRKFKQGVARNVDDEDHESHYDLGVAYKEMGLVDEAIAEFQKALRGTQHRTRAYEALGQCFSEKGQPQVAMTILQRALAEPGATDDQLIGVLYLLGAAAESLGSAPDAVKYYQRVFAVDINFRDVRARMRELEQAGR